MEDEGVKGREIHIAPRAQFVPIEKLPGGGGEQPLWSESREEKRGDERRKKSFEDANYENPLSALLPPRRRNSPRSRLQTAPSGAPSSEFLCGQGIFFNSWVVLSYEDYRSS